MYSSLLDEQMKERTRKQDEARNISSPSPALRGALLCCLPGGVGKGLGAEGFDFSEIMKPSLHSGHHMGMTVGFSPGRVRCGA